MLFGLGQRITSNSLPAVRLAFLAFDRNSSLFQVMDSCRQPEASVELQGFDGRDAPSAVQMF